MHGSDMHVCTYGEYGRASDTPMSHGSDVCGCMYSEYTVRASGSPLVTDVCTARMCDLTHSEYRGRASGSPHATDVWTAEMCGGASIVNTEGEHQALRLSPIYARLGFVWVHA